MVAATTSRQQEILQQAVALIADGGIQKVTTRNLAQRMKFTEPALYRHFKNKEAILIGILDMFAHNSAAHVAALDGAPATAAPLFDFLRQRFRNFTERPAFAAVIFAEEHFRSDRRLARKVRDIMEQHRQAFAAAIHSVQNAGGLRADVGADEIFLLMFGGFRLLVKQWHMSDYAFDLVQRGETFIRSLETLLDPSKE